MTRTSVTIVVLLAVALLGVAVYLLFGEALSAILEPKVFELTYQFLLIVVLGGAAWLIFMRYQDERGAEAETRTRQRQQAAAEQARLSEMYSDLLVAHNKTKKARRLLRARAIRVKPVDTPQQIPVVLAGEYDAQMSDLIDAQLTFEAYARLANDKIPWFEEAAALGEPLGKIEEFLNKMIVEYGFNYRTFEGNPPVKPLSDLPYLAEFIGPFHRSQEFKSEFKHPIKETLQELRKALLR